MLIPNWAKVGAKVVCLDNPRKKLKKGHVYIITDIIDEGFQWGISVSGHKGYWIGTYFKPITTLEDDMKLFEHLKNPSLVDKLDLLAERMDLLYKE